MKTLCSFCAIAAFGAIAGLTTQIHASTIVAGTTVGNSSSLPTPQAVGYDIVVSPILPPGAANGTATTVSSLPSFLNVTFTSTITASPGYSLLTLGGQSYTTGVSFGTVGTSLATVTIGAGAPSSFTLGFLEDSSNDEVNNSGISLISSLAGSTATTIANPNATALHSTGQAGTNDFIFATITGAVPGEIFTVTGTAPAGRDFGGRTAFGGITVDVPEPATLGLLGLAGLGLVARRRRV